MQLTGALTILSSIDVDAEYMETLEEEIFEHEKTREGNEAECEVRLESSLCHPFTSL